MSAEPDLLPLPLTDGWEPGCPYPEWVNVLLTDYARANVARATAARDAEVEALRAETQFLRSHRPIARKLAEAEAEVEALRAEAGTATRMHAITREHLEAAESRAERLAEALRGIEKELGSELVVVAGGRAYLPERAFRKALHDGRAALDQEKDDA